MGDHAHRDHSDVSRQFEHVLHEETPDSPALHVDRDEHRMAVEAVHL